MADTRWTSELHWRRKSQQSRSEQTQEALLDAAEELIVERGTHATTIGDIAKKAGCSAGNVYHHFKDKKALYFALFHRTTQFYADLNQQAADPERWKNANVSDLLEGFIDFMVHIRDQANQSKAAIALVMADNPELRAHISEIQHDGRSRVINLILERRKEIQHPNPEFAVPFIIDQLGAMLSARSDPNQKIAAVSILDDETFKEEAMKIAAHFLGLNVQIKSK